MKLQKAIPIAEILLEMQDPDKEQYVHVPASSWVGKERGELLTLEFSKRCWKSSTFYLASFCLFPMSGSYLSSLHAQSRSHFPSEDTQEVWVQCNFLSALCLALQLCMCPFKACVTAIYIICRLRAPIHLRLIPYPWNSQRDATLAHGRYLASV